MPQTAEASLRSLPPTEQHSVAAFRRQIQHTAYERLAPAAARVVRIQYQRSVADDQLRGVTQRPVEQGIALELLQRRVPPAEWASIAERAASVDPKIEPSSLKERVIKMQNVKQERTVAMPPKGTPFHALNPDQVAEVGRRAVEDLRDRGVVPRDPSQPLSGPGGPKGRSLREPEPAALER